MSTLDITNVINVSVSSPPVGLAAFKVNNLALFTKDVPTNSAITTSAPGIYVSPAAVLADWGSASEAYAMANIIFSQNPSILTGSGNLTIYPMGSSDTLDSVIPALFATNKFYGALWGAYDPADSEVEAAAAVCEPLRIKLFAPKDQSSALSTGGLFDTLSGDTYSHTRALLYTLSAQKARYFAAGYASRGMSVDFTGTATTNTLHLKQLAGVDADTGITQTILNSCQTLGVDTYPTVAGRAGVFCSNGNDFFDNVYNLDWIIFALEVAGYNALALTGTKLPQTEAGMAILRGAYVNVLKQAVANGYIAPGTWNSSEKFGVEKDFIRNISDSGYYLYSVPVSQQSETDRVARKAPLIQIAIKLAGAIHSSSVIVSVNP